MKIGSKRGGRVIRKDRVSPGNAATVAHESVLQRLIAIEPIADTSVPTAAGHVPVATDIEFTRAAQSVDDVGIVREIIDIDQSRKRCLISIMSHSLRGFVAVLQHGAGGTDSLIGVAHHCAADAGGFVAVAQGCSGQIGSTRAPTGPFARSRGHPDERDHGRKAQRCSGIVPPGERDETVEPIGDLSQSRDQTDHIETDLDHIEDRAAMFEHGVDRRREPARHRQPTLPADQSAFGTARLATGAPRAAIGTGSAARSARSARSAIALGARRPCAGRAFSA